MVGVCHGDKRGNVDCKTNTVATNMMKKVADLCLRGIFGKTRKSIQVGLDGALIRAKTRHEDGMDAVCLAGKLGSKTDSMIADGASFGTWMTPRTKGIDTMGNVANHV